MVVNFRVATHGHGECWRVWRLWKAGSSEEVGCCEDGASARAADDLRQRARTNGCATSEERANGAIGRATTEEQVDDALGVRSNKKTLSAEFAC
jgi:hypothetical protein